MNFYYSFNCSQPKLFITILKEGDVVMLLQTALILACMCACSVPVEDALTSGKDSIRCRDIRYKYEESLVATYVETNAATNSCSSEPVNSLDKPNQSSAGASIGAEKFRRETVDEISLMSSCPLDLSDCLNPGSIESVTCNRTISTMSTTKIDHPSILSNPITSNEAAGIGTIPVDMSSSISNNLGKYQYNEYLTSVPPRPRDTLVSAVQPISIPPFTSVGGPVAAASPHQFDVNTLRETVLPHWNGGITLPPPIMQQQSNTSQCSGSQHGILTFEQSSQPHWADGFRYPSPSINQPNNTPAMTGLTVSQYDNVLSLNVMEGTPPPQWTSLSAFQPANVGEMTALPPPSNVALRYEAEPVEPVSSSIADCPVVQPGLVNASNSYNLQSGPSVFCGSKIVAFPELVTATQTVLPSSVDLSKFSQRPVSCPQSLHSSFSLQSETKFESPLHSLPYQKTVSSQVPLVDAAVNQQLLLNQVPKSFPPETVWPPCLSSMPQYPVSHSQPGSCASGLLQSLENVDLSKPPPQLYALSRDSMSPSPAKGPLTAKALAATQNSMFCAMPPSRPTDYMSTSIQAPISRMAFEPDCQLGSENLDFSNVSSTDQVLGVKLELGNNLC
jgi:hypothetical protein